MDTKRIFVGIKISSGLQEKIVAWQKSFLELPIQWIHPEDWHLTLIPPWGEKNIEGVKNVLEAGVAEIQSFEIEFEKILFGPNPKKPRLIWLEGPSSKKLTTLEKSILTAFDKEGQRPLRPHVTIARFKSWQFKDFPIQALDEKFVWKEGVQSVVLFESLPKPENNIKYKVLYSASFK